MVASSHTVNPYTFAFIVEGKPYLARNLRIDPLDACRSKRKIGKPDLRNNGQPSSEMRYWTCEYASRSAHALPDAFFIASL